MVSPDYLRIGILGVVVASITRWYRLVSQVVPDPYLDEVFHVPQAQAYWAGRWSHWDSKITTPPGLYLFSYLVNLIRTATEMTTADLRWVNVLLIYLILVTLYIWTGVSRKHIDHGAVLQKEFCIIAFPLFFFFSGLYYTDLFSAFTVMVTYVCWQVGVDREGSQKLPWQILHVLFGLLSLATRQTNIFWVGIFLGGLQVVETVTREHSVHDPAIADAYFEDFPAMAISLLSASINVIPQLITGLLPHLTLLGSFAAFILWNGGVVLGDKSNHIATIHTPQLIYIWPFIIFFSWPVILPVIFSPFSTSTTITIKLFIKSRLPRPAVLLTTLFLILSSIHFNTIVHPFTLADNRHYTFYIFRILRRHWTIPYLAAPIYLACGVLCILSLGGPSLTKKSRTNRPVLSSRTTDGRIVTDMSAVEEERDTIRASFVLVWFVATALSLVSAPLVEPRYFIMPWLIWRLNVPSSTTSGSEAETEKSRQKKTSGPAPSAEPLKVLAVKVVAFLAEYHLWIELAWYMAINGVTCWMFLYRGFSWVQEPGKVQRFMW